MEASEVIAPRKTKTTGKSLMLEDIKAKQIRDSEQSGANDEHPKRAPKYLFHGPESEKQEDHRTFSFSRSLSR